MARDVYILGMSGFLGSHLQRHFQKAGDRVIGIRHTDPQIPTPAPGAIVINCSARYAPDDDWPAMLRGNYGVAQALFRRCDASHRLINFGSYFEYGEAGSAGPINNYAMAKRLLRGWLEDRHRAQALTAVSFILYDVIGPGDPRPKLIPMLCRSKAGEKIALTACEQIIDLVPLARVVAHVEAWLRLANETAGELVSGPFAISGGDPRPLRNIVEHLRMRRGFVPCYGVRPYEKTQIFRPVKNLPTLDEPHRVSEIVPYLDAMCAERRTDGS